MEKKKSGLENLLAEMEKKKSGLENQLAEVGLPRQANASTSWRHMYCNYMCRTVSVII